MSDALLEKPGIFLFDLASVSEIKIMYFFVNQFFNMHLKRQIIFCTLIIFMFFVVFSFLH